MNKLFEAMGRNVWMAALMVLSVIFISYKMAQLPQAVTGLAGLLLWCVVFALTYVVLTLDAHRTELTKLVEPKVGPVMATNAPTGCSGRKCTSGRKDCAFSCCSHGATAPECDSVEAMIQAKGKTAPRVTPADIEANIVGEHFFTAEQGVHAAYQTPDGAIPCVPALGLLTFCVLTLRNGFTVTGESACASPENFDAEIGRKIARVNAVNKIWPLMGYELRSQLAKA